VGGSSTVDAPRRDGLVCHVHVHTNVLAYDVWSGTLALGPTGSVPGSRGRWADGLVETWAGHLSDVPRETSMGARVGVDVDVEHGDGGRRVGAPRTQQAPTYVTPQRSMGSQPLQGERTSGPRTPQLLAFYGGGAPSSSAAKCLLAALRGDLPRRLLRWAGTWWGLTGFHDPVSSLRLSLAVDAPRRDGLVCHVHVHANVHAHDVWSGTSLWGPRVPFPLRGADGLMAASRPGLSI
jgi:hypothetical protein